MNVVFLMAQNPNQSEILPVNPPPKNKIFSVFRPITNINEQQSFFNNLKNN